MSNKTRLFVPMALLLLGSALVAITYAADGDLDPTFGNGGTVVTSFDDPAVIRDVAVQVDGRIVAAGYTYRPSIPEWSDFALARYLPNGSLDPTFDGDGVVTAGEPYETEKFEALVILPDNRILVAGTIETENGVGFFVGRYLINGALDPSFGENGQVITYLGTTQAHAHDLALQSDGKIVVAGLVGEYWSGPSDFGLVRYHPDGTLDTTFGRGGSVVTDFDRGFEVATAVAIQPDGAIVVTGRRYPDTPHFYGADFVVARYRLNGQLDTTFSSDGHVVAAGATSWAEDVLVQSNGKIVVAGSTNESDPALWRLNPDGSPDTTVGINGLVTDTFPLRGARFTALVAQPDGKLLVTANAGALLVARLHSDLSADRTFGNDGLVRTEVGSHDAANALALQLDGRIVVAGYAQIDSPFGLSEVLFALARYQNGPFILPIATGTLTSIASPGSSPTPSETPARTATIATPPPSATAEGTVPASPTTTVTGPGTPGPRPSVTPTRAPSGTTTPATATATVRALTRTPTPSAAPTETRPAATATRQAVSTPSATGRASATASPAGRMTPTATTSRTPTQTTAPAPSPSSNHQQLFLPLLLR